MAVSLNKSDRSLKIFGGRLNFSYLCIVKRTTQVKKHKY